MRTLSRLSTGVGYSVELKGLVETSHSIGVVKLEDGKTNSSMSRSSVNSRNRLLAKKIGIIIEALGAEGWLW